MKLWVIGVGPGDPRLLTVWACEVLNRVRLVFAPLMGAESESRAYQVVRPYLSPECVVVRLSLGDSEVSRVIVEAVHTHKPQEAAFLVLGDPGLYGSFYRVFPAIRDVFTEVTVIPGISAHQVLSARLVLPLAQGEEIVSIVPGTAPQRAIAQVLSTSATCVVYKASVLFRHSALDFGAPLEVWIGENLATEAERIYPFPGCPLHLPYFSLAILRSTTNSSPIA